MRVVHTANSVYQIDEARHRVRRLRGASAPTPRQGEDGQWQHVDAVIETDAGLLFVWDAEAGRCTLTSPVVQPN